MDTLKYWAIAERDIEIQNPITDRKLRLLEDYCDLRDGLRVLDIGCGKGWLLRQWAERYAIDGQGLELNPHFLDTARSSTPARGRLDFISGPAADFRPPPQGYDIVICLGAIFALGDLPAALDWMLAATKPGGSIVVGDLVLRQPPAVPRGDIWPPTIADTIGIIERHGAEVSATISASEADFERYVSHHRHNTLTWGRMNTANPDHAEVLQRSKKEWQDYLHTIRPHCGWTIFVGRKTG